MRRSLLAMLLGSVVVACGLSVMGSPPGGSSGDLDGGTDANPIGDDGQAIEPKKPTVPDAEVEDADLTADATSPFDGSIAEQDGGPDGGLPCAKPALLIGDDDSSSLTGATSLLREKGFTVETVRTYGDYRGVPSASSFDVIMLLDAGGTEPRAMPTTGQQSIVDAAAAGKGLVIEEWTAHYAENGWYPTLQNVLIFDYASYGIAQVTVTVTPSAHPIVSDLPAAFRTVSRVAYSRGAARGGGAEIARLSTNSASTPPTGGVFVLESGGRRIVETTLAINFNADNSFNRDLNVRKLFANMAMWAARCR